MTTGGESEDSKDIDTYDTCDTHDTCLVRSESICPITLEPIDPLFIYNHCGCDFDIFALYTYLTKSVVYVNPVTRVPFTIDDLSEMENHIKSVCGSDAISYQTTADPGDTDDSTVRHTVRIPYTVSRSTSLAELVAPSGTESVDTSNNTPSILDTQISSVLGIDLQQLVVPVVEDGNDQNDETIRLHIQLNVAPLTPSSSESDAGSECGYIEFSNSNNLNQITLSDLPPSRCYPSIVELFQDEQRTIRMKTDLDLIQFLHYDSLDMLTQIVGLLCDNQFHQFVWEQTYPTLFDTITRLIRDRTDQVEHVEHMDRVTTTDQGGQREEKNNDQSDDQMDVITDASAMDIEVTYSDCFETYRMHVLGVLNRRYAEVIRDIKQVDYSEAELCISSHVFIIELNSMIPLERKGWLISFLRSLL